MMRVACDEVSVEDGRQRAKKNILGWVTWVMGGQSPVAPDAGWGRAHDLSGYEISRQIPSAKR